MKIYTLLHSTKHLGDDKYDAEVFDKNQVEGISGFTFPNKIKVGHPIYFQANFETLNWNDYPLTDVSWPIISQKMLDELLALKSFQHQAIPITMLDDTLLDEEYFDKNNKPLPHLANEEFIALQLIAHTDGFDWEKSKYEEHLWDPSQADLVKKLVFKEPEGGFPPVFRLSAYPTYLYFTEEAKEALEAAGIKGVIFEEVG